MSDVANNNEMLTAEDVAKALADWSFRYPRSVIYGFGQKDRMEGELKAIEEAAIRVTYNND